MIETSIEKFKSVYPSISDLILSLDQKNKVILKPRKEIAIYIDNKQVYLQEDIINDLIELSDIEAISEQYLSDDRIIHGQKVSFKSYLKIKLNTIKSRIKYAQLCEDNRIIQNLKKEIQALNTDSIKINFLLQKKRDLEGNYPESLGKILKKDNIYLFLKKELKFWEIHNEVLDKDISPKTKPLPQLPTNLTNEQRGLLFDLLVKYKFIPDTTNKEGFIWAFGGFDERYRNFTIKWLSDKNVAVYLIDMLCYDDNNKLQSNYLSIGSKIFGIKNMAQLRNGYINNSIGVPYNSSQINEILNIVKRTN